MPLTMKMEQWPIVVITHIGEVSDAEVDAHLAASVRIFERKEPYAIVFDSSRAGKVSPYMRKRSQEWLDKNHDAMVQYCVGNAFVFASPAMRFLLSTMLLFRDHSVPHFVCATLDEGLKWARGQMFKDQAMR
jgi:hypothetical protein